MVGFGQSFKNAGMDLDRKIWQSTHLWSPPGLSQMQLHKSLEQCQKNP